VEKKKKTPQRLKVRIDPTSKQTLPEDKKRIAHMEGNSTIHFTGPARKRQSTTPTSRGAPNEKPSQRTTTYEEKIERVGGKQIEKKKKQKRGFGQANGKCSTGGTKLHGETKKNQQLGPNFTERENTVTREKGPPEKARRCTGQLKQRG